jgi:hypothetical protein
MNVMCKTKERERESGRGGHLFIFIRFYEVLSPIVYLFIDVSYNLWQFLIPSLIGRKEKKRESEGSQ